MAVLWDTDGRPGPLKDTVEHMQDAFFAAGKDVRKWSVAINAAVRPHQGLRGPLGL